MNIKGAQLHGKLVAMSDAAGDTCGWRIEWKTIADTLTVQHGANPEARREFSRKLLVEADTIHIEPLKWAIDVLEHCHPEYPKE